MNQVLQPNSSSTDVFPQQGKYQRKLSVLWEDSEMEDDWMTGLVKNNRGRVKATDDEMPPLDLKRCLIALLPGDEGYNELMEIIHDEDSVWSDD